MAGSDTIDIISVSPSTSGESSITFEKIPWPKEFVIPDFRFNTALKLQKGDQEYKEKRKPINTTGIKSDILAKCAEAIFKHKAYPTEDKIESVAAALVKKHPCLKEPGSSVGYYGWNHSLTFKMGNYRSKLQALGCAELTVNSLKRKETGELSAPAKKSRNRGRGRSTICLKYQQLNP